jgi:hypothetical protein
MNTVEDFDICGSVLLTVEDIYRVVCVGGGGGETNMGSVDRLVCKYLTIVMYEATNHIS